MDTSKRYLEKKTENKLARRNELPLTNFSSSHHLILVKPKTIGLTSQPIDRLQVARVRYGYREQR